MAPFFQPQAANGTAVVVVSRSWDRCYDFLNIFDEKFSEKIGVFDSKQS
jgi:hypothetical protein